MDTNVDAVSLKPCPFCGSAVAFMPYKRDGLKIECKPCTISYQQRTMRFDLKWLEGKMTVRWNRRSPTAEQAEFQPGTTEYGSWINKARNETDMKLSFHRDPFKYLCQFQQELKKLAASSAGDLEVCRG